MKKPPVPITLAVCWVLIVLATQVVAQQGVAPTLALSDETGLGLHLVDAHGMSLYLYTLDEEGTSACGEECSRDWSPVLVEEGAEITVGSGLNRELIGTISRTDGTSQLTYGGAPLYTFKGDTEPGNTMGHGVGAQFFLVSATGTAVMEAGPEAATTVDGELIAALMSEGQRTFSSHCAVCHGATGGGSIGPSFIGNSDLMDSIFVINRVLDGFIEGGMPAFGPVLSDREVAGVATLIRSDWGNEFGPILEEEVAAER